MTSLDQTEKLNKGFWEKMMENPWVPLGAIATTGVLGSGLVGFLKGNGATSQNMMRFRVLAQGITVAVLVFGSGASGVDFYEKQKQKQERLGYKMH